MASTVTFIFDEKNFKYQITYVFVDELTGGKGDGL